MSHDPACHQAQRDGLVKQIEDRAVARTVAKVSLAGLGFGGYSA